MLGAEVAVVGLRRRLQAARSRRTASRETRSTDRPLFQTPIGEIGAAMRTMQPIGHHALSSLNATRSSPKPHRLDRPVPDSSTTRRAPVAPHQILGSGAGSGSHSLRSVPRLTSAKPSAFVPYANLADEMRRRHAFDCTPPRQRGRGTMRSMVGAWALWGSRERNSKRV